MSAKSMGDLEQIEDPVLKEEAEKALEPVLEHKQKAEPEASDAE